MEGEHIMKVINRNSSLERENGGLVKEVGHLKEKLESAISGNRARTYLLGLLTFVAGIQQVALQTEALKDEKLVKAISEKTKSIADKLQSIDDFYDPQSADAVRRETDDLMNLLSDQDKSIFEEAVQSTTYNFMKHPSFNPETGDFEEQK